MSALSHSEEDERIAKRINHDLHIVTPQYRNLGWFSTFKALFQSEGLRRIYNPTDRPPFPVIMDKHKLSDLYPYIGKGDFFFLGTCYAVGVFTGWYLSRSRLPTFANRLAIFHYMTHIFTVFGLSCMFLVPSLRIRGYMDNGLKWKRPRPIKKYDFTSGFDKHPVYKHFRLKVE